MSTPVVLKIFYIIFREYLAIDNAIRRQRFETFSNKELAYRTLERLIKESDIDSYFYIEEEKRLV